MMKKMEQGSLEQEITTFVSAFIKKTNGRGPRDIKVKMVDNLMLYFIEGILSPMEKYILQSPQGKSTIFEARRLYVENIKEERIAAFEKILSAKVIDHYIGWDLDKDSAVGVVVYEK
ncbi:Na-translocating system protein MpsC family protein [Brevibacillus fluminis]|uniref:Na-translocating system protein MpsC family protein n=1 Tax=Brevibacillus fluminis TaxID=511487 RepID=UPI003F8953E9